MSGVEEVNARREKLWLSNALNYQFQRLFRWGRDPKKWVFGAWEGCRYADNARALFEYVNKSRPDIEATWIATDQEVCNQVRKSGFRAFLSETRDGRDAMEKAGVAFYTNGLDDFGANPSVYGAFIVNLFHGVGFKKVYHEQNSPGLPSVRGAFGAVKRRLFDWVACDALVTTSEYMRDRYRLAFELSQKAPVFLSGQPRNDSLVHCPDVSNCLSRESAFYEKICSVSSFILYMPTWSDGHDDKLLAALKKLSSDQRIDALLKERDALFVLKPHYLSSIKPGWYSERVAAIPGNDVLDNDGLIASASSLITDFSSCAVDFALSGKPTAYFLHRDLTLEERHGLVQDYFSLVKTYGLRSLDDIIDFIRNVYDVNDAAFALTRELNKRFAPSGVHVGEFSQKTCDLICDYMHC